MFPDQTEINAYVIVNYYLYDAISNNGSTIDHLFHIKSKLFNKRQFHNYCNFYSRYFKKVKKQNFKGCLRTAWSSSDELVIDILFDHCLCSLLDTEVGHFVSWLLGSVGIAISALIPRRTYLFTTFTLTLK